MKYGDLKALFEELEQAPPAAAASRPPTPAPAEGSGGSGGARANFGDWTGTRSTSPRPQQQDGVQPPHGETQQPGRFTSQQQQQQVLPQQHSLGLMDRLALQQRTRLQVGLPARGGSKTFSLGSWVSSNSIDAEDSTPALASPRPLRGYDGRVAAQLERHCMQARRMLERLQEPVLSVAQGGAMPPLPSAALRFCRGLAFVQQRKAGLLGAWTWGDALIIRHLPDGAWSAPVFMRMRFASLGLTAGAQRIRSVHVLQTPEQVSAFTQDCFTYTLDATMPAEMDPFEVNAPIRGIKHQDFSLPPAAAKPHCAMLCEGIMLDLSVRTGFTLVNDQLHGQVYGEGVTPEDILSGRFALPPELLPLFEDIEERAAEARVIRPTVSKFALARQQSMQRASRSTSAHNRSQQEVATPGSTDGVHASSSQATHTRVSAASAYSLGTPSLEGGSPNTTLVGGCAACASLAHGCSCGDSLAAPAGGSLKLFGDVDIGFSEMYSYEFQEAAEQEQEEEEQRLAGPTVEGQHSLDGQQAQQAASQVQQQQQQQAVGQ